MLSDKLKGICVKIFFVFYTSGVIECYNVPCTFNTMCMCWVQDDQDFTKMNIACMGTPFARFPDVSVSYVAQLVVVGSGLQTLDNDALTSSVDVEALVLMNNRLSNIADKSFSGIADKLRSLDLSYNALEDVPFEAFRDLRKLKWLNMESNYLTSLDGDWGHAKDMLTDAFFSDNSIIHIPKSFSTFESLVRLYLDNNNIEEISEDSLPPKIHTLSLNSNLLKNFPSSLKTLKALTLLHLRGNDFKYLELPDFQSSNLELIDVSENSIEWICAPSLANRTLKIKDFNMDSNKLNSLPAGIFDHLDIKRIHLSSNSIKNVDDDAFRGLEDSLEYLNLENNDLPNVPGAVSRLKKLSYLYLADNDIRNISGDAFQEFGEDLRVLSLATNNLDAVPVAALLRCVRLLHLNLDYNKISHVQPGDFEWAEDLEILLLRNNVLTKLSGETFKGASRLHELSLSFNHLTELDDDCFAGIEKSLGILELSFAFATDVFPQRALRPLSELYWLDLDNNNFQTIEATAFYSFQRLRYINLESNRLHYLPERIFLSSVHPELTDVKLGYNFLEAIPEFSFHNLTNLTALDLTGNRIKVLGSESILDCPKLVTLSLAYNRISRMEKNALYGLPSLRFLHLEFNKLTALDLDAISEIGGLDFALNVSYNAISVLNSGSSINNLTRLDLSFNNISQLPVDTFYNTPDLRSLDLQSNFIAALEPGTFFGLSRLETLNLQDNKIESLRKQSFHGLSLLQQLDLSGNLLNQLPTEQFRNLKNLRILNLSDNKIRSLPRDVFEGTKLEILDLSRNKFTVVPSPSFLEVGYTLRDLDMADNFVDHLDSTAFPTSQLVSLNLAHNRLTILPDNSFVSLGKLLRLNMSQNILQTNFKELFHYLPGLRQLYLTNCSFRDIPLLPLTNLNVLDLSFNYIDSTPDKQFQYLKNLKVLLLVNNSLTSMPNVKLNLLRELDVSGNPIEKLTKESFMGYPRLEDLKLRNLNRTRSVDKDCLRVLKYLKHLRIQTWPEAEGFHLRYLLTGLPLRTVEIQVTEYLLKHQIQNAFTKQLRELTISGNDLEVISSEAFSTIEGGELILRIKDTRVRRLQSDIFLSLTKTLSRLTLDLRNNHINELSPSVIYGNLSWESVGTNMVVGGLQVSGNPLECDCEIAWLSLWLRRWLRESRQIHVASQYDARQLRMIAGRAVCTETTPSDSSDKVLLTLGTPHTACQASALSSGNYERLATTWLAIVHIILLTIIAN
ncbi:chaoptin [Colletes gigas]|uniref:chaoptin n=1 Tax=Colletes gigas TaxID=935657 RepID=UPI001C9AB873|nr:chaoptin [Colletes gigas]XP_043260676.1 chaoptin [Colletes gigas]XP_043260678.1 chaoptin [Colletes gigas]XP_043260679.1 chaoptin [Colletes gigas]XP_043260680.1 chaoptin [Colletes gigas]XP_043260681.1 chaoptin [Colletes gigas]